MINIDSRLLDTLDADELYVLCRITNRIGSNKDAFPGNDLLCKECGWHIEKLLRVKKSLEDKGILKVLRKPGRANRYSLGSTLIGNHVNGKSGLLVKSGKTTTENPVSTTTEILVLSTTENQGELVRKNHTLSINQEVLINEVLTIEELNREKRYLSIRKHEIFKILILCIYPTLEEYKHLGYLLGEGETDEVEDPTIKKTLEKILRAAGEIYNSFDALKRPLPEWRAICGGLPGRGKDEIDPVWEATDQIKAYTDYCRISKTFITTDLEKLQEKLIQVDWCEKFLSFIKPQIEQEKYDPAYEDDELWSGWLIDMYYDQPLDVLVCKRYTNRIVYAGEEYLISKK